MDAYYLNADGSFGPFIGSQTLNATGGSGTVFFKFDIFTPGKVYIEAILKDAGGSQLDAKFKSFPVP